MWGRGRVVAEGIVTARYLGRAGEAEATRRYLVVRFVFIVRCKRSVTASNFIHKHAQGPPATKCIVQSGIMLLN